MEGIWGDDNLLQGKGKAVTVTPRGEGEGIDVVEKKCFSYTGKKYFMS